MKILSRFNSVRSVALVLAVTLSVGNILLLAPPTSAASLSKAMIRLPRLATGQAANSGTNGSVLITFQTVSSGTSLVINMNGADSPTWATNGGTVVNGATTVVSTGCATDATGATPAPGTLTGTGVSASTQLTVATSTSFAAATYYCAYLTGASVLVNPTTAGTYHPTMTIGSDNTTVAINIITNDQIIVTAVVPPTFSFALGGSADSFTTNLNTSATPSTTTGVTATVNTNAKNGWVAWVKDANGGLTSATASKTIASATAGSTATFASNTELYSVGAGTVVQGSGAGTTSLVSAYGSANGAGVDTTLRQIASSTGTANGASFTLKEYANISATTPAANDYTDTITVIGAGSF